MPCHSLPSINRRQAINSRMHCTLFGRALPVDRDWIPYDPPCLSKHSCHDQCSRAPHALLPRAPRICSFSPNNHPRTTNSALWARARIEEGPMAGARGQQSFDPSCGEDGFQDGGRFSMGSDYDAGQGGRGPTARESRFESRRWRTHCDVGDMLGRLGPRWWEGVCSGPDGSQVKVGSRKWGKYLTLVRKCPHTFEFGECMAMSSYGPKSDFNQRIMTLEIHIQDRGYAYQRLGGVK